MKVLIPLTITLLFSFSSIAIDKSSNIRKLTLEKDNSYKVNVQKEINVQKEVNHCTSFKKSNKISCGDQEGLTLNEPGQLNGGSDKVTYTKGSNLLVEYQNYSSFVDNIYYRFSSLDSVATSSKWQLATLVHSRGLISVSDYIFNLQQPDSGVYTLEVATDRHSSRSSAVVKYFSKYPLNIERILDFSDDEDQLNDVELLPDALVIDSTQHSTSYVNSHDSSVGYIKGNLSVSANGAASYSMPIELPKGAGNTTPSLSLNYNSSVGNDMMGKGWSVGGQSSIIRCGQDILIDGKITPIQWNNEDRFCFNGSKLVLKSGVYGQSGSTYTTEIEQHTTITLNGNANSGSSSYFTVSYKNGSTSYLGNSTNSKNVTSSNKIYKWAINEKTNIAGNSITYSYYNSANQFYLTEIDYSVYSVVFNTEFRFDQSTKYVAGHPVQTTNRINKVYIKKGSVFLQTYHINYKNVSSADIHQLSKIESIQLCAGINSSCFPATTFDWTDAAIGYENTLGSGGMAIEGDYITGAGVADMNGDGFSDLVLQHTLNPASLDLNSASADCTLKVYHGGVNGLSNQSDEEFTTRCAINSYQSLSLQDINNDNRADHNGLITSYNSSSRDWKTFDNEATNDFIETTYGNSTYGKFTITSNTKNNYTNNEIFLVADVNGDGLNDFISWIDVKYHSTIVTGGGLKVENKRYYAKKLRVYLAEYNANGNVILNKEQPYIFNLGEKYNPNELQLGDFNGDGRLDILVYNAAGTSVHDGTGAVHAYSFPDFNTTNNVSLITSFHGAMNQVIVADINNDGLSDIVGRNYFLEDDDSPDSDMELYYFINDGTANDQIRLQVENITSRNYIRNYPISLTDYNQDGFLDIMSEVDMFIWQPSRNKFVYTDLALPSLSNAHKNHIYADFNGDGRSDIIELGYLANNTGRQSYYYNPVYYSNIDTTELPNRIKTITSGNGVITSIEYENIAASDNHKPFDVNATGSNKILDDLCITTSDGYCRNIYSSGANSESEFYKRLKNGPLLPSTNSDSLGESFAIKPVSGSLAVVTSVTTSNPHTSGNEYSSVNVNAKKRVYYHYGRAFSQQYRGFLGFETVTTVDQAQGIETQIVYRQDFPFSGRVAFKEVRTTTGKVLSATYTDWRMNREGNVTTGNPIYPYQVYAANSQTASHDSFTGSFLKVTRSMKKLTDDGHISENTEVTFNKDDDEVKWTKTALIYSANCNVCIERGLPTETQITYYDPEGNDQAFIHTKAYTYYQSNNTNGYLGQLASETVEPYKTAYTSTKTYAYDSFGNSNKITLSAAGLASRTSHTIYDRSGRYVEEVYNAKNHLTQYTRSVNNYGQPTIIVGLNGLVTTLTYDAYGRQIKQATNDGDWSSTNMQWCNGCYPGANMVIRLHDASGAISLQYVDLLGRTIHTLKVGFSSGQAFYTDSKFDAKGNLVYQSEPYSNRSERYWTAFGYDVVGRKIITINPDRSVNLFNHDGFVTTSTNALKQVKIETKNAVGQLIEVEDHEGGRVHNTYDALGNLRKATSFGSVSDRHNIKVEMFYDDLGRKIAMNDPDKGYWQYSYNAFGELVTQTNANLETTENFYDVLGRLYKRVDRTTASGSIKHTTYWTFDGAVPSGAGFFPGLSALGVLTGVTHNTGNSIACSGDTLEICKVFTVDSLGRPYTTRTKLGKNNNDGIYSTTIEYDNIGRVLKEFDVLSTASKN